MRLASGVANVALTEQPLTGAAGSVPRQLIRAANHDRNRSLGWLATAWLEYFVVHGPGDVQGEQVHHTDEQTGFIVDCYALDEDGRRLYDSAFLSRPKGTDKSGQEARFGLFEAFGPCRGTGQFARGGEVYRDPWGFGFEYQYQPGEPMGRPIKAPVVRCLATEEGQVGNVYNTIHFNLTDGPLANALARKDDAGLSRIIIPGGGQIIPSTASSSAKDGGIETFLALDETHLYNRPELRQMYKVTTRNLRKRKKIAETWYLEGTTMYQAGEDSSAEETYKLAQLIQEGKTKRERLLLDHRWGEVSMEDLDDEAKIRAALTESYGDALAWNDLDGLVNEVLDPRTDITDSIRYFFNDSQGTENSWVQAYEWRARFNGERVVADGEAVTLGFDGSRKRGRGVTDATALVACTLSDGHVFPLDIWEQPAHVRDWEVPVADVLAAVDQAFDRYRVVGFYADPAKWESHVAGWEAKYGPKLALKSTAPHPIEWWMTGGRSVFTVRALEKFRSAIIDGEMTHDGSSGLTRHMLAARMVSSRSGVQIGKEHPTSERKIDAAVAATLAWQARLDALAKGIKPESQRRSVMRVR